MYYIVDKESLRKRIYEEVSRVADEAYGEDGTSLYDAIVLTSRDREMVGRMIDDAVHHLVRRAFDICMYSPMVNYQKDSNDNATGQVASVTQRLLFHVPDLDESMEPAIMEELSQYIIFHVATAVFRSRRAQVVPQHLELAMSSLDRAVTLLKSRKAPNEIC